MSYIENVSGAADVGINIEPEEFLSQEQKEPKGLHVAFNKDTLEEKKKTEAVSSAWPSWVPFLGKTEAPAKIESTSEIEGIQSTKSGMIPFAPALSEPNNVNKEKITIPPFSYDNNDDPSLKISDQRKEALAALHGMTQEQVMFLVFITHVKILTERGETVKQGIEKLHELKTLHQRSLLQLKEDMEQDQKRNNVLGIIGTGARYTAMAFGFAALTVATLGLSVPALLGIGTVGTAGVSAVVHAVQSYSDSKTDQHKSVLEETTHAQSRNDSFIGHHSNIIQSIADTDNDAKEFLMKIIQSDARVRELVNS